MKTVVCCLAAVFLLGALPASGLAAGDGSIAVDPVVISANKIKTKQQNLTASVSVVSESDMEAKQVTSLTDILNTVPGVLYNLSGGLGQYSTVSIRGAAPRYTQYRFDDFPLKDITGTQSDLSMFTSNLLFTPGALGSIEVLKGSQGTLYGSNAMGGVISLFPRKWGSEKESSFRLSGGSYDTIMGDAALSWSDDENYVNFSPMGVKSTGYKHVWYEHMGFVLTAGHKFTEKTSLELTSMASYQDGQMVNSPSRDYTTGKIKHQTKPDDSEHRESHVALVGLTLTHDFSEAWQTRVKTSYTRTSRTYFGQWYRDEGDLYLGEDYYAEILNTIKPLEQLTLLVGADYNGLDITNRNNDYMGGTLKLDEFNNMGSVFGKAIVSLLDDKLTLSLGGRYNYHDEFDGYGTWDVGISYLFPTNTRLYGSVATGYRTPSQYETYGIYNGVRIGNKDLDPETSTTYEVGIEQSLWDKRIQLGAAVYWTDFKDYIGWGDASDAHPDGHYYQTGKGKLRGFETHASVAPIDQLKLELAYTYADSEEKTATGWQRVTNLPYNTVAGTAYVYPVDGLTLALTGRWVDSKLVSVSGSRIEESSYFNMDFAASYDVTEKLSFFGRVNNLFDRDYTNSFYEMPGINFMAGVKFSF